MTSQLDANTYGVGQLITQRKLFVVPEHQRHFAWTIEEIELYLSDIANAATRDAPDYFIGLIVLQGPVDTAWQILDGQQRLVTTTMIYSAIREWLASHSLASDAQQIDNEFIGVRHLGGKQSPRLRLNSANRDVFDSYIVNSQELTALRHEIQQLPKRSSNRRLLEGSLYCREWIAEYASSHGHSQALFSLSSFLENKVKVVCVDVSSQTDAYILFESLNDRGADLSALDLVKNYIFSQLPSSSLNMLKEKWAEMMDNLEDKDADDFLKVFWTSQFGVVHKLDLFNRLREVYPEAAGAEQLINNLLTASDQFEALDDPEHGLWTESGLIARQLIGDLRTLGNRQSRPLIMSALNAFPAHQIEDFLWLLIVVVVRYQIVAKGRTGFMEKQFASLAKAIHSGEVKDVQQASDHLKPLIPENDAFFRDFCVHSEAKNARVHYLLLELESTARTIKQGLTREGYQQLRSQALFASPQFLVSKALGAGLLSPQDVTLLGNRILLEDAFKGLPIELFGGQLPSTLKESSFFLTKSTAEFVADSNYVYQRGTELADLAVNTWCFPRKLFGS